MSWKKRVENIKSTEDTCAQNLYEKLAQGLRKDGRIRAEDLITAAASIAAELCIEAAGDIDPRKHLLVPGSRVFSDKVNELFCGNSAEHTIAAVPAESIVGMLRDSVLPAGYNESDFPSLKKIFEYFAANIGNKADWGKVPLSLSEENKPSVLPLRLAYETRSTVDQAFHGLDNPQQKLRAAVLTLGKVLIAVQKAIDRKIAILLALEILNGMAKTAPMTDEAMAAAKIKGGRQ